MTTPHVLAFERGMVVDRRRLCLLPLHVVLMMSIVLAGLAALSVGLHEPAASHDPIAIVCGLAVAGLIVYIRYALRLRWISASMIYLMLFWMFHFGLAFTAVAVPDVLTGIEDRRIEWLYWPSVRAAMILSVVGAAGFVLGVGLTGARADAARAAPRRSHESALYTVGWAVMLAGLAGAIGSLLASGGLGVLAIGYREFRDTVLGPTLLLGSIEVAQAGCMLALCGAGGRRWVLPLAVWAAFGGVLLLLGLRNEALIPLVGFVVVLAYRGIHFGRGLLLAVALASIVVIPAIRTFRQVGFSNRALVNWTELSPLATFVELGGTLRAVKAYVDWIDGGDPYLLGASYWAPIDRQLLSRIVPGRERIAFERDARVPGRDMALRESANGTASTGEAYYNFGPLGPFLYLLGVGALFGWLERRAPATPYRTAVLSIMLFPFYWNIRSEWIAVPAQVTIGLLLVGICYALRGRAPRPSA